MAKRNLEGAWGEALAAEYLRKKKCNIVAAGYRSRFGEIDLIAEDKQHILFVEVKLRKTANFAQAREYVDRNKQDRIRVTAMLYLSRYPTNLQPRFDVVEVYCPLGLATEKPKIIYLEGAFV